MRDISILFFDPHEPRTGFLSVEYVSPFTLEEKRWPTVYHYLQAKKFEGTHFQEEIRKAPTVYQVKRMTRGRTITVVEGDRLQKKRVYGVRSSDGYCVREDWKSIQKEVIFAANQAKFQRFSLRRRLLETHPARLVCRGDPLLGPTLQKIRESIRESTLNKRMLRNTLDSDLKSGTPSLFQISVIKSLMSISSRISKIEGWDRIQSEMVDDAIHILVSKKSYSEVMEFISHDLCRATWTHIYRNLPNTERIISRVQGYLTTSRKKSCHQKSQVPKFSEEDVFPVSLKMVSFLRLLEEREDIRERVTKTIERLSQPNSVLRIPKIQRSYRKYRPPRIPRELRERKSLKPNLKTKVEDVKVVESTNLSIENQELENVPLEEVREEPRDSRASVRESDFEKLRSNTSRNIEEPEVPLYSEKLGTEGSQHLEESLRLCRRDSEKPEVSQSISSSIQSSSTAQESSSVKSTSPTIDIEPASLNEPSEKITCDPSTSEETRIGSSSKSSVEPAKTHSSTRLKKVKNRRPAPPAKPKLKDFTQKTEKNF